LTDITWFITVGGDASACSIPQISHEPSFASLISNTPFVLLERWASRRSLGDQFSADIFSDTVSQTSILVPNLPDKCEVQIPILDRPESAPSSNEDKQVIVLLPFPLCLFVDFTLKARVIHLLRSYRQMEVKDNAVMVRKTNCTGYVERFQAYLFKCMPVLLHSTERTLM
jgi:hypothetical protein